MNWAARFKRAKEAKTVADAGVNAGFDPNHDPYKNLHRFNFTQTLEVCGSLDPKVLSKLLHSTTIFYQNVAADISASAAFQSPDLAVGLLVLPEAVGRPERLSSLTE